MQANNYHRQPVVWWCPYETGCILPSLMSWLLNLFLWNTISIAHRFSFAYVLLCSWLTINYWICLRSDCGKFDYPQLRNDRNSPLANCPVDLIVWRYAVNVFTGAYVRFTMTVGHGTLRVGRRLPAICCFMNRSWRLRGLAKNRVCPNSSLHRDARLRR